MNTLLKLFKYSAGMALGLLLLMSPAAHAATPAPPATVLAINTDTSNSKLYVEISYVGKPCLIYQLKFGIGILDENGLPTATGSDDTVTARPFKVVTGAGDDVVWRIDDDDPSNGSNTAKPITGYITKVNGVPGNDTLMYDMQISGYRLEFDLLPLNGGARVRPSDSIKVCLRSQMKPIMCEGCGTAGSDRKFSLNDIANGCPYEDKAGDMLACYHRDSKVQNWEGWIVDARDCGQYRIVQMPDNKWWMAQNLNFQGTTGLPLNFHPDHALPHTNGSTSADYASVFWCPDSITTPFYSFGDTSPKGVIGSLAGCKTYGALYSYSSLMLKDGRSSGAWGAGNSDLMNPVSFGDSTLVRGICPEGWAVPSAQHWGKMLNMVEKENDTAAVNRYGCTQTGVNSAKRTGYSWLAGTNRSHYNPCMHVVDTATVQDTLSLQRGWHASQYAYKDLLGTNVAPYREMDTIPNYLLETFINPTLEDLAINRRQLKAPKELRRVATVNNPAWNYFYPESAGTDKYGFSILPAGMKYFTDAYTFLGESAVFWTSTSKDAKEVVSGSYNIGYAFRYNLLLNHLMPHAIYGGHLHRKSGASVRCIADSN